MLFYEAFRDLVDEESLFSQRNSIESIKIQRETIGGMTAFEW